MKKITYERLLKELRVLDRATDNLAANADKIGNNADKIGNAAVANANKVGNAADAATNTFQAIGNNIDPLCASASNAMGSIQTAGNTVDKSLKILTPVVAISAGLFGAVQASKLFKSIKGSRSTSEIEVDFENRELADQFAGTIATHKELKPYCKVKSIQSQKVVLAIDTKYLEKNFNKFQQTVAKLKSTNAKRTVGEGIGTALATGAAMTLGGMLVKPAINKLQGKSGETMQVNYKFKDSNSMNEFAKFIKSPEMAKATAKISSEDNVNKVITLQGDEKKLNTVFSQIEQKAADLGAVGGDNANGNGNANSNASGTNGTANNTVSENTKVTLTIGQLKKLIKETVDELEEGWSDDPANDPEDGDWEMNPDGTFKRDANGKKIPKSFRKDIKNFWNKLRGRA